MKNRKIAIGLLCILCLSFLFVLIIDIKPVYATTTTFDSSAGSPCGNGHVYKTDANYATAHDATTGTVSVWTDNGVRQFGQRYTGTEYIVWRQPIRWDTSSLPDNCVISSAKIRLYLVEYGDMSDTDFIVRVQKWTRTDNGWADTTDYSKFDGTNYDDGTSNTVSWVEQSYNNITLSNFDIINKITYYGNNLIKITNQTMKIERHNLFPEFILLHKLHNNFKYVLSNSPYIMYEKDFELFLFLNFLQNDISKFYYVNQDEKYC